MAESNGYVLHSSSSMAGYLEQWTWISVVFVNCGRLH